jgi:hypothetical protein
MVEFELLTDEGWRPASKADPASDPDVLRAMRELQQEANQARVRARLEVVDGEVEEAEANQDHVRTRLQAVDDEFTRQMLALGRETSDA